MAKFSGEVGYAKSVEGAVGVYVNQITKRIYYGDLISNQAKNTSEQKVNDNVILNPRISIVADSYAHANLTFIKFVKFNGAFWDISNVEAKSPRLILTLGGVYNGPTE